MKKKLILFLEDDRSRSLSLQRAFAIEGYDVLAASDGFQALEILQRDSTPDAVVMDFHFETGRQRLDLIGTVLSRRRIPTVLEGAAPGIAPALGSWRIDAQVPKSSDFSELSRTVTRVVGKGAAAVQGAAAIGPKRAYVPYHRPYNRPDHPPYPTPAVPLPVSPVQG